MKIKKVPAVKGFCGVTYAVYHGEQIVKIFLTKKEAEQFVKENS